MAVAIGTLIIGSAAGAIVLTLRINAQNRTVQTANLLSQELIDNARSFSQAGWTNLYNVASKGPSTNYYLVNATGADFTVVTGKEGVPENEIRDGLVGQWKLDEASGVNAYDSSGVGNNGTLTGSPVRTVSCFVSDCLTLSGTGQYVTIAPPSGFPTTAITVSAWVYLTGHINFDDLVANNFSAAGGWNLFADSGGNALFGVFNGVSQFNASGCAPSFTLNAWHHLLGTYDGTTVKVYLDGVQCTTTSALASQTLYTAGSVRMGDADGTSASHRIDDVKIYKRAVSAAEVTQTYNSRPFTRYLSVENVNRDSGGSIVATGGTEDPSTQKVTATVSWSQFGGSPQIQASEFLTRSKNEITQFSNWNGGSGAEGPVTSPNTGYSSQTKIDASTTPGSIQIQVP